MFPKIELYELQAASEKEFQSLMPHSNFDEIEFYWIQSKSLTPLKN